MNVRTTQSLRVALAQEHPVVGGPDVNLARIADTLAATSDVDLMVWPELYLCGYTTARAGACAEALDGPRVARLRDLAIAHDTALVVGLSENVGGDRPANSALAIDRDGRIAGCYRKTQLFGEEASAFAAGQALTTARLCGVRVGLMICFDIEFPEVARALALDGADLLVSVSANMTPFAPDHRLCLKARALENRRAHVYVNQVGQGEHFLFTGESAVADSSGTVVQACDAQHEETRCVDVSLAGETDVRPDYLALRREPLAVEHGLSPGHTQNSDR